jgi:hypothetical protein
LRTKIKKRKEMDQDNTHTQRLNRNEGKMEDPEERRQ